MFYSVRLACGSVKLMSPSPASAGGAFRRVGHHDTRGRWILVVDSIPQRGISSIATFRGPSLNPVAEHASIHVRWRPRGVAAPLKRK
jgi:hypothetical protein